MAVNYTKYLNIHMLQSWQSVAVNSESSHNTHTVATIPSQNTDTSIATISGGWHLN